MKNKKVLIVVIALVVICITILIVVLTKKSAKSFDDYSVEPTVEVKYDVNAKDAYYDAVLKSVELHKDDLAQYGIVNPAIEEKDISYGRSGTVTSVTIFSNNVEYQLLILYDDNFVEQSFEITDPNISDDNPGEE